MHTVSAYGDNGEDHNDDGENQTSEKDIKRPTEINRHTTFLKSISLCAYIFYKLDANTNSNNFCNWKNNPKIS